MVVEVLREKLGEEKVEEFRELLYEASLDIILDYSSMMK
jgi:phosphohistidine phosphatase SixA